MVSAAKQFDFATLVTAQAPRLRSPTLTDQELAAELSADVLRHVRLGGLDVPAMPSLAARALKVLHQGPVEMDELVALLSMDPATATQIVKAASSQAALAAPVMSIREGIARLGLNATAQLVAAVAMQNVYRPSRPTSSPVLVRAAQAFWQQSLVTAHGAAHLVRVRNWAAPETAYLGGMLCNIGRAVALRWIQSLGEKRELTLEDPLVLYLVLDFVEHTVGALVTERWALAPVVAACCTPRTANISALEPEAQRIVAVVTLASVMSELALNPYPSDGLLADAAQRAEALELTRTELEALAAELCEVRVRLGALAELPSSET